MSLIRNRQTSSKPTGSSKGGYVYRHRAPETVQERANRRAGDREGIFENSVQFFSPKAADNNIRILPPSKPDAQHYGIDLWVHYGIGVDESQFLCLEKMKGEKCPICEERASAVKAGEEALAKNLRPNNRVGIYLIDRDAEGKGPLVWPMPQTQDKAIAKLSNDKKTGILAIDDPEEGYDVSFYKEGEKDRTKYTAMAVARRASPLSDDAATAAKWLQYIVDNPLEDKLVWHDYDYIMNAFAGTASGTAPNEEVEDPKTRKEEEPEKIKERTRGGVAAKKTAEPDKPSWDDMLEMTEEDDLQALAESFDINLDEVKGGFESLDDMRTKLAGLLDIVVPETPKEEPPPAGKPIPAWKKKLEEVRTKGNK